MKLLFTLSLLLLACTGCPPKPIPTPTPIPTPGPPPDGGVDLPACTTPAVLKQEDICDGFFTKDDLSCVRCSNVKGCVDQVVVMYCTTGPCADDPACTYRPNPLIDDGSNSASSGKKSKRRRPPPSRDGGIAPNPKPVR